MTPSRFTPWGSTQPSASLASENKPAAKKAAGKKAARKTATPQVAAKKAGTKASKKAGAGQSGGGKSGGGKSGGGKSAKKGSRKGAGSAPQLKPIGKRRRVGKGEPSQPPEEALQDDDAAEDSRRNFGLRGAAPWVARHAAKHAEELRVRNAEPPPPGSARATLRTPEHAEELKDQILRLHQRVSEIQAMRATLDSTFFEIGLVLDEVQREEMFVAKGYSTFEAFLDRESGLQRGLALRLLRIVHTFQRDTAYDYGLDRLMAALAALDGAIVTAPASNPSRESSRLSSSALPHQTVRWEE